MLSTLGLGDGQNMGTANGKIALDCSVRKTKQGHVCISTTDFFFPLVDSPYLQGRIGAAKVLSDAGIVTTVRKTRGDDIDAACGQLAGDVKDRTRAAERMAKQRTIVLKPVT